METKNPEDFSELATTAITLRIYTAAINEDTGDISTSVKQTGNPMWCVDYGMLSFEGKMSDAIECAKSKISRPEDFDLQLCYPLTKDDMDAAHKYRILYGTYLKTRAPDYNKKIVVLNSMSMEERAKLMSDACKTTYYDKDFILIFIEDDEYLVDMNIHLVRPGAISRFRPEEKKDDGFVTVMDAVMETE